MKRILLLMIAGLLAFNAQAQFSKGEHVVSGTASFGKSMDRNTSYYQIFEFVPEEVTQLTIAPRFGGFVTDQIEIGGLLSYQYVKLEGDYYARYYDIDEDEKGQLDVLMVGPYVRRYLSLNEWASFYFQGNILYGRSRAISGDNGLSDANSVTRTFNLGANPGVALRFGKVGIELQASLLNYTRSVSGLKDDFAESKGDPMVNWEFGPNLSNTSLGFSFYF